MSVRDDLYTAYTLFARSSPIRQVVEAINTEQVEFYVVIRSSNRLMVTTRGHLKERLAAFADEYGEAVLELKLSDLPDFWKPQNTLAPDDEAQEARAGLRRGEALPVLENGKLVGIFRRTGRPVGSAGLGTLYGLRFALFNEQETPKQAPSRRCPHCNRIITFYKPKRIGDRIERYCPHCERPIPSAQS